MEENHKTTNIQRQPPALEKVTINLAVFSTTHQQPIAHHRDDKRPRQQAANGSSIGWIQNTRVCVALLEKFYFLHRCSAVSLKLCARTYAKVLAEASFSISDPAYVTHLCPLRAYLNAQGMPRIKSIKYTSSKS